MREAIDTSRIPSTLARRAGSDGAWCGLAPTTVQRRMMDPRASCQARGCLCRLVDATCWWRVAPSVCTQRRLHSPSTTDDGKKRKGREDESTRTGEGLQTPQQSRLHGIKCNPVYLTNLAVKSLREQNPGRRTNALTQNIPEPRSPARIGRAKTGISHHMPAALLSRGHYGLAISILVPGTVEGTIQSQGWPWHCPQPLVHGASAAHLDSTTTSKASPRAFENPHETTEHSQHALNAFCGCRD